MLFNRKGQAATEFAVLGSLVILVFAFLISYSEKLNHQQAYIQQTFRAALKEARAANSSGSYTKVAFRRMSNVGSPMELGQLQSFSNSANVLWADGKSVAVHGVSKYQLNEAPAIDIPYRATPVSTTEVSTNSFTNDLSAVTTFVKTENGGNINTTKSLLAIDALTANVAVSGTQYNFVHNLGYVIVNGEKLGGKYYPGPRVLSRPARDME